MSDKQSVPEQKEIKDDIPSMSAKDMRNPKRTQGWKMLKSRYGENVSLQKLSAVAKVMMQCIDHNIPSETPSLSREDIRSKEKLILWFDTHIEFIRPFLSPGMMIGYDKGKFVPIPIPKETTKKVEDKEKEEEKDKEKK